MANNKVQLANGTVLIDITDTTASASDVLSGEYFYNASGVKTTGSLVLPQTYTVSKTLSNITTNNDDTEVLSGGSFYMDLTPSSGMVINSITVTMGGVDVTEQVFKAGVRSKIITQNGIYNAEDDGLEGYSSVNVNVQNSYTSSDEGKVVNNGTLVAQTSDTVTQNGTVDTTLINSLTVNVSTGTGYKRYKSGTYTPPQTYNSTGNRAICTITDIGFTPSKFILEVSSRSTVSGVQYVILRASRELLGSANDPWRIVMRYSNTSNSIGYASSTSDWNTQSNYHLYLNNGTIYYRTTSTYILPANIQYTWEAYE